MVCKNMITIDYLLRQPDISFEVCLEPWLGTTDREMEAGRREDDMNIGSMCTHPHTCLDASVQ